MQPSKPLEGHTYPLRIEGYSSDGAGVARLDGMVEFVQGGVRGGLCQVRLTHVGRSALWGVVKEITEPSPARITPDCPYYDRCGGCAFRHITYAEE